MAIHIDSDGNFYFGASGTTDFDDITYIPDFSVTKDGVLTANSGTVGGITLNSSDIQANYSSGTSGFKIDTNGDAEFNSVDIRIEQADSDTPSTGFTTLDIGSTQIYENGDDLYINTSGTNNFVKIRDRLILTPTSSSASNMQLMFDGPGSGDAMGFWHDTDFPNSSNAELYWTNQSGSGDYNKIAYVTTQDDYFHIGVDSPGIKFDYTGSPTVYFDGPGSPGTDSVTFNMGVRPYSIKDKDGDVGTSGQVLSSTGSRIDWIDLPSGNDHPDSDHSFAASGHDHDSDYDDFDHIDINNLEMRSGYGLTISGGSGISISSSSNPHTITITNTGSSGISGAQMGSNGTGFLSSITSGSVLTFNTTNTDNSTIHVGSLDPSYSTSDIGNSNSDRFADIYAANHHGGVFYGTLVNSSSQNVKENIADNTLGLDFINSMVTKQFNYITRDHSDLIYTGMIAEDLSTVLSDNSWDGYYFIENMGVDKYQYTNRCSHVVKCECDNTDCCPEKMDFDYYCENDCCSDYFKHTNDRGETRNYLHHTVEECEEYEVDGNRHPHINYYQFVAPLIKAVQELSTQISDLTARVEVLEG